MLNGGGSGTLKAVGREVLSFASTAAALPGRLDSVLGRLDQGTLNVRSLEVEKGLRRLDGSTRRVTAAIIFAVLFAGGIALRLTGDDLGTALLVASAPVGIYALGFLRLP